MPHPTHESVPYGPHERQKLDLWLAKRKTPAPFFFYIHGGGFVNGDKNQIPDVTRETLLAAGVSIMSCNYRFTGDPEYRAPVLDPARALQFVRHHAQKWNLDKSRVAAGGSSAGAVTAFWLGFRPDRAQPRAVDPIARESTHVRCIASSDAQTTIDPNYIHQLIAGSTWEITSIQKFFRLTLDQYETPRARKLFKEFHFIDQVTPDSPPVFLYDMTRAYPLEGIHHPRFGSALKEAMDPHGVECVLRTREQLIDMTDAEASRQFDRDLAQFVIRHIAT